MNNHDHSQHAHSHDVPEFSRAFLIAIVANGIFVIFQIIFAILASSSSLLADAIHNFGDVLGLILAWIANGLLKHTPTYKTTYGLKKTTILAALANGAMLVFTCGIIASDAVYKLLHPSEVQAVAVMIVAGIGILVNSATAVLFLRGRADLNIRAAYLHLLYDAFISVGVVISAALLYWTGWQWIDPLMGLLIALIILKGTWSLCKDSLQLLLDGVPREVSLLSVREFLLKQEGVEEIHDLHVWALSTQENALSVHLLMPEQAFNDEDRQKITQTLKNDYAIQHTTIQIEKDPRFCEDACISPH